MKTYLDIFAWIYAVYDLIARFVKFLNKVFLKCYPYCAGIFVFYMIIGLEGGSKAGRLTAENMRVTYEIIGVFCIITLLYIIDYMRKESKNASNISRNSKNKSMHKRTVPDGNINGYRKVA